MDNNVPMEAQLDLEKLRSELRKLPRKQVRALAIAAGLSPSTVEKFRLGHIDEPRLSKLQALQVALKKKAKPKAQIVTADYVGPDRRKQKKGD
jgi:predicted transcriptional regulator